MVVDDVEAQMDLVTVSIMLVDVTVLVEPLGQISIISIMTTISTPMYSPQRSVVVAEADDEASEGTDEVTNEDTNVDDETGRTVLVEVPLPVQDVDDRL